jgi:hypothetical protein
MNRIIKFFCLAGFIISFFSSGFSQEEEKIWKEFMDILRSGKMTVDKIHPHPQIGDTYKPIFLGFLDSVRAQASAEDWTAQPEIIKIENRIQYIVPWSAGNKKISYCFSIVLENSGWYFQHLETIFIRLDKIDKLPASKFPDISENQKNWIREETYWSFVISNLYMPVVKSSGQQAALDMLKDGGGYFVSAKTWVPFTSPYKAFILYLCWEQANLRGNNVSLEKLEDNEATVRIKTQFFSLYTRSAHMRQFITIDDYKQIFETIWQDRAKHSGWKLEIKYSPDYSVIFNFKK